ncbi:interferon-induced protein 44-like [Archocentrus centrarchus]|uniref:interferon-induced protein 44-like n=1 Tax=Archocentrus centrarchus TaxID=63155 RepID=UPI0011E9B9F9|nr:interferon-induced protein 44-like [Archocentrus centrarchus]
MAGIEETSRDETESNLFLKDTAPPEFGTTSYQTHKLKTGRGSSAVCYPLVFNDIMGLVEGTNAGVHPDDIKLAMRGHVREGHKFNPVAPLSEEDPSYNQTPSADDKVHVLVCIHSANASEIKDSVLEKMSSIRQAASDLGIPQMAIITKIDEACPETQKDPKNVYESKHLKKKMSEFSSALGIQMNCIFPVKNYSEEIKTHEDVDTLILSALRSMINFGDDFIENL